VKNTIEYGFCTPDLSPSWPKEMRTNPYVYGSTSFGDTLSPHKPYEYFQIGNFKGNDYRNPCAISVHFKPRRQWKFGSTVALSDYKHPSPGTREDSSEESNLENSISHKAALTVEHPICGIGIDYPGKSSIEKFRVFPVNQSFVGQKGEICADLLNKSGEISIINRVKMWHREGLGRVSRLQFYHHNDPKSLDDSDGGLLDYSNDGVLPSEWNDTFAWGWSRAPPDTPGQWVFAGIFGAFEKVGLFGRDRALAKIAVAWKKMDDK